MLEELDEQRKPTPRVMNPIVSHVLEHVLASITVDLCRNVETLTERVRNNEIVNDNSGSFSEFLNKN